ncbi:MAG: copper amine oxidase family proteinputative S-layer protein [Eubacterium sp.]|nr:copper amine oxidase family proteinputative S-layer protein [Eubacterium sp.]
MLKKPVNKIIKVITAAIVSGGILLSSIPPVQAATVRDIGKSSNYARAAVQWMAANNVISGDKYGNFNPGKKISRAELVTIIVKALNIDMTNLPETPTFSDVPKKHWAYAYVEAANRAGIVSGIGNGKFGINNMSTREQVTTILMSCLAISRESVLANVGLDALAKFKDEGKMSDWAKASIQFAISNNLMSGTGSDTFSPAGLATKEQIAFILYNFITNKENLNQVAENLKKPVITFNGDILKLSDAPELATGDILVPADAFIKMGADVAIDEQKSGIVIKNSTSTGSIHLKTGNNTAYVNYAGSGDPFSDTGAQSNAITLTAAPKVSGEGILVPVKAVSGAIGMTVEWNTKTNLVAVKDITAVKYPLLYNALKDMLNYKGEYKTSLDMSTVDTTTYEEIMSFNYTMEGVINGTNSTSKSQISATLDGEPIDVQKNEVVSVGGQLYSKNIETGVWSKVTKDQAEEDGIMYYDVDADRIETQKMLDMYDKMAIVPNGKAVINGEQVSKYQIKVGTDILSQAIPSELLGEGINPEDIYNNGFNLKYEVYINNKGQLVKQTVKFTGGMKDDYFEMEFNMIMNAEFTNIGKEIQIVSPI